jgi:hypothetical protein
MARRRVRFCVDDSRSEKDAVLSVNRNRPILSYTHGLVKIRDLLFIKSTPGWEDFFLKEKNMRPYRSIVDVRCSSLYEDRRISSDGG